MIDYEALFEVLKVAIDKGLKDFQEATKPSEIAEADILSTECVPLVEAAIRQDGTIPLKIIAPGWGSSGYYSPQVLEKAAPVFKTGTKMFWDHPTPTQEAERPEGSLSNLAAELVTPARWDANGAKGPGLYADAKVFEGYKSAVDDLAPHIGVSIRGFGRSVMGEAEGRKGAIIQEISGTNSIDFVTIAGAGGEILQLFESRRPTPQVIKETIMSEKDLKEAQDRIGILEQQNKRLQEALLVEAARKHATVKLVESTLPAITQKRLVESLIGAVPTVDGSIDTAKFNVKIGEAIAAEAAYLVQIGIGQGQVSGLGSTQTKQVDDKVISERLSKAFAGLGLSESGIKHATNGRI